MGLTPFAGVRRRFPASARTALRFRGRWLCGCNLFAFLGGAARAVPAFWARVVCRVVPVILERPEAALDVDSLADLELCRRLRLGRPCGGGG